MASCDAGMLKKPWHGTALALWDATVRTTFGVERIHVADKCVVSNLSILVVRQRVADGCQVIGFELRARINGERLSWLDWFFLFEGVVLFSKRTVLSLLVL